jgi:DNA polymerase III alpha subunit
METNVDAWGRVTVDFSAVSEALLQGLKLSQFLVAPSDAARRFNRWCEEKDRAEHVVSFPDELPHSPAEEHARRASQWLVGGDLADLDVREFVLSLCSTDEERDRVEMEMDLYEERGLVPLLRAMLCVVDHCRNKGVLWGVGRGSSVASFVLFKIGVHRIDSLRYGLDVREFLKDEIG